MVFKIAFIFSLTIIALERSNGELTVGKKCDEGWQGEDCEFCAGKVRSVTTRDLDIQALCSISFVEYKL